MSNKPSREPTVLNIELTNANTEYPQLFPNNVTQFSIVCTSDVDVRFAYEIDKVATPVEPYITLPAGVAYYEDETSLNGKILYLASDVAGVIIEIIYWK